MYRSRDLLFYTASLMIANDLMLLDRYLKYPSKEPDYRKGRSHFGICDDHCIGIPYAFV